MPNPVSMNTSSEYKAYVITGPTSGIGRATTLEVIKHGKVVLVGRESNAWIRVEVSDSIQRHSSEPGSSHSVDWELMESFPLLDLGANSR